jgi:hypothetical protein
VVFELAIAAPFLVAALLIGGLRAWVVVTLACIMYVLMIAAVVRDRRRRRPRRWWEQAEVTPSESAYQDRPGPLGMLTSSVMAIPSASAI